MCFSVYEEEILIVVEDISLEIEGSSRLPVGWRESCFYCLRRVEIENLFHQEFGGARSCITDLELLSCCLIR